MVGLSIQAACGSVIRQATAPIARPITFRAFHASSSALKGGKASTPAQQEGYEEEPETDEPEQDLFATSEESHPEPSKAEIIAKAETFKKVKTQRPDLTKTRARLIESIHTAAALPPKDRMHQQLGAVRVGTLRRVVAASISVEQLEELRGVLKGWRVMGMRVTEKTAEEIVGRCINLERPDLALEFTEDRLQYGLPPLRDHSIVLLQQSLRKWRALGGSASLPTLDPTKRISPTLALTRLSLLHTLSMPKPRATAESAPEAELTSAIDATSSSSTTENKPARSPVNLDSEVTKLIDSLPTRGAPRQGHRTQPGVLIELRKAGSVWEEAGNRIWRASTESREAADKDQDGPLLITDGRSESRQSRPVYVPKKGRGRAEKLKLRGAQIAHGGVLSGLMGRAIGTGSESAGSA